jgi:hypothetical protein
MKGSLKNCDNSCDSYLFRHVKRKILEKKEKLETKSFTYLTYVTSSLDRASKKLKKTLKRGRNLIEEKWDKWLKQNKKFV